MKTQAIPMTELKLQPPELGVYLLERSRLAEKVHKENKIILITAPGGYGKTVLASQMLKATNKPFVWCQLDEQDNDPILFFHYLINGFSKYISNLANIFSFLDSRFVMDTKTAYHMAILLGNELKKYKDGYLYLVLDDFHTISDSIILDFVNNFLKYLPKNIRIIITSRKYPELSLAKLKAGGYVCEIDKEELLFNYEEFLDFCMGMNRIKFDEAVYEKIYKISEGWPLAINVMVQASHDAHGQFQETFSLVNTRKIFFNFFAMEILKKLPENVQNFLLMVSPLEKLTSELCDFVLERNDSGRILEYLTNSNVFISRMNGNTEVYTCHQLFREFLQNRIPGGAGKVLTMAGQYYMNYGNDPKALDYFFHAKNFEKAVDVFGRAAMKAFRSGRIKTLERWIALLQENGYRENEWVIFAEGIVCLHKGMLIPAEKHLQRALAMFEKSDMKTGYYNTMLMKSRILLYKAAFDEGIKLTEEIIQKAEEVDNFTLYEAFMQKTYIQVIKSDFQGAIVTLELGVEMLKRRNEEKLVYFLFRYLTVPYYMEGFFNKATYYYNFTKDELEEEINWTERFSVDLYMARAYRDMGELEVARKMMEETLKKKQILGVVEDFWLVYYHLAALYRDMGEYTTAMRYVLLSEELFVKNGGRVPEFLSVTKALKGLILLYMGEADESRKMIERALNELPEQSSPFMSVITYYTAGLIYIAEKEYSCAKVHLEQGLRLLEKTHENFMYALYNGLMAVILKQDQKSESVIMASKCLSASAAEKYVQPFVSYEQYDECLMIGIENGFETDFIKGIFSKLKTERIQVIIKKFLVYNDSKNILNLMNILKKEDFYKNAGVFFTFNKEQKSNYIELLKNEKFLPTVVEEEFPLLLVTCFGRFEVYSPLMGEVVKWRTSKARELLAYFIQSREKVISTEKILSNIWPDTPPEKARDIFHTNLGYVKKVLKSCGLLKNLKKQQMGYQFLSKGIYCDEWLISDLLKEKGSSEIKDALGGMMEVFRQHYLEDIYSEWADEQRNVYEALKARFSE